MYIKKRVVLKTSKILLDKQQKVTSYDSWCGVRVYEIAQYNADTKSWYIVGDCSDNRLWVEFQVEKHNKELASKN